MKKTLALAGLLLVLAAIAAPLAAQTPGTLKAISFQKEGGSIVVTILIDGPFSFEPSELTLPRRLVLDLSPVERNLAAPYTQLGDLGVSAIRSGQLKAQTARVIFDLSDPAPTHAVTAIPGGLRISFGPETEAKPEVREAKEPVVKEQPKEAAKKPVEEAPAEPARGRTDFFVRAGAGMTLFLKPNLSAQRSILLYGETGTIGEAYHFKSGLVFDGSVGKYMRLGNLGLKAGLGVSFWRLANEGTFNLSLPHPFLLNAPRAVSFTDTSSFDTSLVNIYAYGLFSFLQTDRFSVWFGPLVGVSTGKFRTLGDFDIQEKAPFTAADVTITNRTATEDSVSGLIFGGDLSLEMRLGRIFSLVLDTKMVFVNPKVANLGLRVNLLQVQPTLGLQITF